MRCGWCAVRACRLPCRRRPTPCASRRSRAMLRRSRSRQSPSCLASARPSYSRAASSRRPARASSARPYWSRQGLPSAARRHGRWRAPPRARQNRARRPRSSPAAARPSGSTRRPTSATWSSPASATTVARWACTWVGNTLSSNRLTTSQRHVRKTCDLCVGVAGLWRSDLRGARWESTVTFLARRIRCTGCQYVRKASRRHRNCVSNLSRMVTVAVSGRGAVDGDQVVGGG
jgi:hypothetical protein